MLFKLLFSDEEFVQFELVNAKRLPNTKTIDKLYNQFYPLDILLSSSDGKVYLEIYKGK